MLRTQTTGFGFYGSLREKEVRAAWALALPAIVAATGCEEDEVRDFLDSRYDD